MSTRRPRACTSDNPDVDAAKCSLNENEGVRPVILSSHRDISLYRAERRACNRNTMATIERPSELTLNGVALNDTT